MLDILASTTDIKSQTTSEKLYLLKILAHQWLGAKWVYYRRIKHAGEDFKLFRQKSLAEQMKATQAALRFTSKHAKKSYRTVYRSSVNDIKKNTGIRTEDFPALSEVHMDKDTPSLTTEQDEVIISWTPEKFLLPSKTIREKGVATQPHSEGLVAKLFFKVVGFYATKENWDKEKLTIYLRKIHEKSTVHEVTSALSTLKDDLLQFSEMYVPFKFGKASLAKDKTSDEGVFDDDLGESFEDLLRTLYWHHFIYIGMEQFLLQYYLILVSSTSSTEAVRYLSQIFKPAFARAIENTCIFEGSFETDNSKRKFRKPYLQHKQERSEEPKIKKIKTKEGFYEVYSYNLKLLQENNLSFELQKQPEEDSAWGEFIDFDLMDAVSYRMEKGSVLPESVPQKTIDFALVHILAMLIKCTQFRRRARHKSLERFQKRVEADRELTAKRVEEIRRTAERQIRQMQRKIAKLRRMDQKETADVYRKDIEIFRRRLQDKCDTIEKTSQQEIKYQKRRLRSLFEEITAQDDLNEGNPARFLLGTVAAVSPKRDFLREFTKQVSKMIQDEYDPELEPLYKNLFHVLDLSVQEKVIIIQSLEKSEREDGVRLTLTEEEQKENQKIIKLLQLKIRKGMPDIFDCKAIFMTTLIPIEDMFKISVDNESLKVLLSLKVSSKRNAKPILLKEGIVKALMVLNLVKNPVPKHNVLQGEREHMKDPQKIINGTLLTQLLNEMEETEPASPSA